MCRGRKVKDGMLPNTFAIFLKTIDESRKANGRKPTGLLGISAGGSHILTCRHKQPESL